MYVHVGRWKEWMGNRGNRMKEVEGREEKGLEGKMKS